MANKKTPIKSLKNTHTHTKKQRNKDHLQLSVGKKQMENVLHLKRSLRMYRENMQTSCRKGWLSNAGLLSAR